MLLQALSQFLNFIEWILKQSDRMNETKLLSNLWRGRCPPYDLNLISDQS